MHIMKKAPSKPAAVLLCALLALSGCGTQAAGEASSSEITVTTVSALSLIHI